jgi:branched-subunit amino acid ABC-type transport system permease component
MGSLGPFEIIAILVLVLLFRPEGIFGKARVA